MTSTEQRPEVPGKLVAPGSASAYYNAVMASVPFVFWPCDDAVGTTSPREVAGGLTTTGSGTGSATFGTADPWGGTKAVHIAGPYVFYNNTFLGPVNTSAYSVECWVRAAAAAWTPLSLQLSGSLPGGGCVELTPYNGGQGQAQHISPGVSYLFSDYQPTADNQWHHWCFTHAADGGFYLYVDGVQRSNNAGKLVVGGLVPSLVSLGADCNATFAPQHAFTGDVCMGALYARPLSAREVATHYATTLPAMTCVRQASLVSGANTVQLDNPGAGWACSSLDLGFPAPRVVTLDRPDTDGTIDRTSLASARSVTVAITAVQSMSPAASIDTTAAQFAPFMVPGARPVLHYVLDRPGAPERTLTMRPAAYDWPVVGPAERDIALQWVAPDPYARDVVVKSVTDTPGGSASAVATSGDVAVRPVLSFYGPITQAVATFTDNMAGVAQTKFGFVSGYVIAAGNRVDVDLAARTAYLNGDKTKSVLGSVDWSISTWPQISVAGGTIALTGSATTAASKVVATWQDGFLT